MPTKKVIQDFGRQYTLAAVQEISYADGLDGTLDALTIQLPEDAIVTGGYVVVETAFNTGTTHVINVGYSGSLTAFATAVNLKSAAATALVGLGTVTDSTSSTVTVGHTPVGADATAGAATIVVEYVVKGRANENQD